MAPLAIRRDRRRPDANYLILDLDRHRPGENGLRDFRERDGRNPLDLETPIATTPSGGLHLYFRANGLDIGNIRLLGSAIDVKSVGGYVLAPGHRNGRDWVRSPRGPWALAPEWLKALSVDASANAGSPTPLIGPNGRYRGDTPHALAILKGHPHSAKRSATIHP
jgi:hypothetical protein